MTNRLGLLTEIVNWLLRNGGLAQLARAPALHAGGHRFDSDILHNGYSLPADIYCQWRLATSSLTYCDIETQEKI